MADRSRVTYEDRVDIIAAEALIPVRSLTTEYLIHEMLNIITPVVLAAEPGFDRDHVYYGSRGSRKNR